VHVLIYNIALTSDDSVLVIS